MAELGVFLAEGLVTDQRHQTKEVCHLSSDGIQDHYHKFWENARSFIVYDWMLKNAKKLGSDRGVVYFTTNELDHSLSHERRSDKSSFRGRAVIIRLIDFLEDIEMIKILQRPLRKGSSWRIKVLKYKCDDEDFPMLVNVQKKDPTVSPAVQNEGYVSQDTQKEVCVAQEAHNPKEVSPVAEVFVSPQLQKQPDDDFHITPLDTGQLEIWDMVNRPRKSTKSDKVMSHSSYKPKRGWVGSNPCYDWMLDVPGHNIGLFCVALKSAWVDVTISNSYILTISESINNSSTFEEQLLCQIKAGETKNKSSEEIIEPDRAIKICEYLHKTSANSPNPKARKAAQRARDEFFYLYWNGLSTDGKTNFHQCVTLENGRRAKIDTRFSGALFRTSWAHAFIRIKKSPHCNSRTDRKWKASFDWVIRSDTAVTRAIEGVYDGRERKKSGRKPKGIQRTFGGGSYLKGLPITKVDPSRIKEWEQENPEAAAEARKSGLWDMRFGKNGRNKT